MKDIFHYTVFIVCSFIIGWEGARAFTHEELSFHTLTILCGAAGMIVVLIGARIFNIETDTKQSLENLIRGQEDILKDLQKSNKQVVDIVKAQAELLSKATK